LSVVSFSQGTAADVLEGRGPIGTVDLADLSIADASETDVVLLARFDDSVVGYLAGTSDLVGGLVIWEHVVVEGFRNRGIGRRLLLEAARRTPPMSLISIDPVGDFEIDQVAAYYSRLGFPADPGDRFRVSVPAHQVVDTVGEQAEENTTVETILHRKSTPAIVTVRPDAPIGEALELMSDLRIGSVVVSADGSTVAGILSERDVVVALHDHGVGFVDGSAGDYMTTDITTVELTDVVSDVMEIATIKRLRHMPVMSNDALVGAISVGDLVAFRMREHDMRSDQLPFRAR